MIAIGISATPIFIRLTRGQVLGVKAEDYVDSARAIGLSTPRILARYILPNVAAAGPGAGDADHRHGDHRRGVAVASWASASSRRRRRWGSMLNTAKNFLNQAPWMALWPGVAIFLVVLGFNLLGDGLRDALDPREQ